MALLVGVASAPAGQVLDRPNPNPLNTDTTMLPMLEDLIHEMRTRLLLRSHRTPEEILDAFIRRYDHLKRAALENFARAERFEGKFRVVKHENNKLRARMNRWAPVVNAFGETGLEHAKALLAWIRTHDLDEELLVGSLADWAYSVEVEYQLKYGLDEDDWGFSPKDRVNWIVEEEVCDAV